MAELTSPSRAGKKKEESQNIGRERPGEAGRGGPRGGVGRRRKKMKGEGEKREKKEEEAKVGRKEGGEQGRGTE